VRKFRGESVPGQALYLKWRPTTFDDVIGQEHITRTLRNALIQNRIRHAYLFNGPRGTGKTTMARILAKAVNCLDPDPANRPCDRCAPCVAMNEGRFLDLIEIDAASHNGVDDVRDLRDKIAFAPSEGHFKVYIVDEVHRFSPSAFDALLKTLEEPPDHAIFILATTELDKVPATIRSRSLLFEFRRVSIRDVADRLELIAASEGVMVEREVLELVAGQGTGSVRDSISLLDQLIANPNERITLEYAERALGTASSRTVGRLVEAVLQNDAASGLELLNQAIEDGADPAQFGRQIVEYLRSLMIVKTGGSRLIDTNDETRDILEQLANLTSRAALIRAVRAFNDAVGEIRTGWQPQLPLEMALVECARPISDAVAEAPIAPSMSDAPERSASPAAASSGPAPLISVSSLQQKWPEIIQRLKSDQSPKNKSLGAELERAYVLTIEGQSVILAVKANESWLQERLEAKQKTIAEIIKRLFQVEMRIKVVLGNATSIHQVDDTIANDPVISQELNAGGSISYIDNQGGTEE